MENESLVSQWAPDKSVLYYLWDGEILRVDTATGKVQPSLPNFA